jgi:hypothetical protein
MTIDQVFEFRSGDVISPVNAVCCSNCKSIYFRKPTDESNVVKQLVERDSICSEGFDFVEQYIYSNSVNDTHILMAICGIDNMDTWIEFSDPWNTQLIPANVWSNVQQVVDDIFRKSSQDF